MAIACSFGMGIAHVICPGAPKSVLVTNATYNCRTSFAKPTRECPSKGGQVNGVGEIDSDPDFDSDFDLDRLREHAIYH